MPSYSRLPQHSRRNPSEEPPRTLQKILITLSSLITATARHIPRPSSFTLNSLRQRARTFRWRDALNLPNVLILVWIYAIIWGERWTFHKNVQACDWKNWERWGLDATPHHLIFIADPQLIDPHTYPDRPWPLSSITATLTDNYLQRSYIQLQEVLHPDTLFFLGDLFDGGREWIPDEASHEDPAWAQGRRPSKEQHFVESWHKRYGQKFWLKEYDRFGRIFFDHWNDGGVQSNVGQRGRKVISSLPGNHDLGFAEQISLPVRNRFNAFFGDGNRVDVIGNHTFVSVDTVSLSARDVDHNPATALIYEPVEYFLDNVKAIKRRALNRELKAQHSEPEGLHQPHRVEDLYTASFTDLPTLDPGEGAPDLPTILLTHVPLYREPGTPCGPMREHWPPTPPPEGQLTPVFPDHRNAISVSKGYQYQNVLSESDSVALVEKIGNVKYAFSGDDHDYCEVLHPPNKNSLREITVKSMSFAMSVRKPAFMMLSLWNPLDGSGQSFGTKGGGHGPSSHVAAPTIETHLCLLPDQLAIFINYAILLGATVCVIILRALLMPVLKLQPLFPYMNSVETGPLLPLNEKRDRFREDDEQDRRSTSSTSSTSSLKTSYLAARSSSTRTPRTTSPDFQGGGYGLPATSVTTAPDYAASYLPQKSLIGASKEKGVYNASQGYIRRVLREVLFSMWRVAWPAGGFFLWLCIFG